MKQRLAEWYNFCGVDTRESDIVDAEPTVQLGHNRYVCLPFLHKAGMIIEIEGDYYYSLIPLDYSSESLMHYTVSRTEGGYYLRGRLNKFPLSLITEEVMDTVLYPIPAERRKERDEVMAKYKGKEPFSITKWM